VAAPLIYDIQALGVEKTVADLEGISHRMTDAEPAFVEAARILERGERRLFTRLHGKYVRTGATRDSLTQPAANHAIREAHADELVFGTSVWYARFLRKKRGKSAVLVLQPTERKQITRTILDYITGE
jgi:hypothetical protein